MVIVTVHTLNILHVRKFTTL